jgi:large subunit ribosomal protein L21
MFAVLKTGGKQYKVASGDVLRIEKLAADAGDTVQFNEILMVGTTLGLPLVAGAAVQAEVIDHIKGEKVIHFVKRRRKHSSQRTKGHRQQLTLVRITDILESGGDKTKVKAAANGGGYGAVISDGRYAKNKTDQAEMARRVNEGEAEAKSAETTKAEPAKRAAPKTDSAPKAENAKAAPKAAKGGDDLKQLSGVGPALEQKLHAAGVTTFAQIAAWSKAEIAEIDEKLDFKGRIDREDWVAQAKKLAKG